MAVVNYSENIKHICVIYLDLDGWRTNGGTVPPELALTSQVPDLVLVDKSKTPSQVVLLELTCPFDTATLIKAALDRKELRYRRLTAELRDAGYNAINLPLEIGSRGVINARNHGVLATLAQLVNIKDLKNFRRTLGKTSLLGSYRIWLARRSQEWAPGGLIQP